jgi:hypothetical protein
MYGIQLGFIFLAVSILIYEKYGYENNTTTRTTSSGSDTGWVTTIKPTTSPVRGLQNYHRALDTGRSVYSPSPELRKN